MSKKNVYLSQTRIIKISQFSRRHTDEVHFFFLKAVMGTESGIRKTYMSYCLQNIMHVKVVCDYDAFANFLNSYELPRDKTNKMICTPNEDSIRSDQASSLCA